MVTIQFPPLHDWIETVCKRRCFEYWNTDLWNKCHVFSTGIYDSEKMKISFNTKISVKPVQVRNKSVIHYWNISDIESVQTDLDNFVENFKCLNYYRKGNIRKLFVRNIHNRGFTVSVTNFLLYIIKKNQKHLYTNRFAVKTVWFVDRTKVT